MLSLQYSLQFQFFCSHAGIQCKVDIQERIKDKIVLTPNSVIPKTELSCKLFLLTKWQETKI